ARGDPGEESLPLEFVAEGDDDRTDHLRAERKLHRRAGVGGFLLEDELLNRGPSGAAEFARPCWDAPPPAVQALLPAREVVLAQRLARIDPGRDFGRQIAVDELAHDGAKVLLFRREFQMHAQSWPASAIPRGDGSVLKHRGAPAPRQAAQCSPK